jgi:hypothetical protein
VITATVGIKNEGNVQGDIWFYGLLRKGEEIVYFQPVAGHSGVKKMGDGVTTFVRVTLQPGEVKNVTLKATIPVSPKWVGPIDAAWGAGKLVGSDYRFNDDRGTHVGVFNVKGVLTAKITSIAYS